MLACRDEKNFINAKKFVPERWLDLYNKTITPHTESVLQTKSNSGIENQIKELIDKINKVNTHIPDTNPDLLDNDGSELSETGYGTGNDDTSDISEPENDDIIDTSIGTHLNVINNTQNKSDILQDDRIGLNEPLPINVSENSTVDAQEDIERRKLARSLVVPFGVGRRMCPGKRFVDQELLTVVATVNIENDKINSLDIFKYIMRFTYVCLLLQLSRHFLNCHFAQTMLPAL